MITKEDILESITGALLSDKPTHAINIPIGWIFQAMQQYAEEYHLSELLKLNKSDVISWVAASEKLPTVDDNGHKVLIYRIMNNSQESLAISIHDTSMVKHCNPNETWWMELPKPPCL